MKTWAPKCVILLFLFIHCTTLCQQENNNWYFGFYAGVTFSSGFAIAVSNGAMTAVEGCATISDSYHNAKRDKKNESGIFLLLR